MPFSKPITSAGRILRSMGIPVQGELDLGINYAPERVRIHGLRDAHTFPLVSPDRGKVQRSMRVHASEAWGYPRIEIRAENSWPALTFDCDGNASIEKLIDCATFGRNLPKPNVIVQRKASGNCHASWFLARPVHRGSGARLKPQRRFGRIAEFYQSELCADPGYSGALTLNPMYQAHHGAFKTWWGCKHAYSLDELAEPIPDGWQRPRLALTSIGRNVDLFRALMRESGKPSNWGRDVRDLAVLLNAEFEVPLPLSEVETTARSVNRIQQANLASGQTQRAFAFLQSRRGKASAVARRAANAQRDFRIIEGHAAGWSQRHLAKLFKLSKTGVWKVLNR